MLKLIDELKSESEKDIEEIESNKKEENLMDID